jgi:ribosome biogenesis GTPase
VSSRIRLGWDPFFEAQIAGDPGATRRFARVVQEERGAYRVAGDVEGWTGISGRYRHLATADGDLPAVGDWVALEDDVIVARLERRSVVSRVATGRAGGRQVIAANVDVILIVTSANEDLNPRRLERYLAMVWESGALPVVVMNKSDLAEDPDAVAADLRGRLPFVDIVTISAIAAAGEQSGASPATALAAHLQPGRTLALVGSSGVGKSTLVNALAGGSVQRVSAIRESDGRGRHTTTARQLIELPGGALLIDTPGMRELQPWGGAGVIDDAFADIAALAADCRFTDCQHQAEPGCAVRSAIDAGTLAADRLEHFRHLQREAAFEARKADKAEAAAHKRRWKQIANAQKAMYRDRERLK